MTHTEDTVILYKTEPGLIGNLSLSKKSVIPKTE